MKVFLIFMFSISFWAIAEKGVKPLPLQACSADAERAVKLNDEAILTQHHSTSDRVKTGVGKLEEALDYDSNNPEILFNLAQFYLIFREEVKEMHDWNDEQLFQRVEDYSRRAAEIGGSYQFWYDYATNLLYSYKNLGLPLDPEKSANAWKKVRDLSSTQNQIFNSWVNEGRVYLWVLNKRQAQACFEEALKIKPQNATATSLLEKSN